MYGTSLDSLASLSHTRQGPPPSPSPGSGPPSTYQHGIPAMQAPVNAATRTPFGHPTPSAGNGPSAEQAFLSRGFPASASHVTTPNEGHHSSFQGPQIPRTSTTQAALFETTTAPASFDAIVLQLLVEMREALERLKKVENVVESQGVRITELEGLVEGLALQGLAEDRDGKGGKVKISPNNHPDAKVSRIALSSGSSGQASTLINDIRFGFTH